MLLVHENEWNYFDLLPHDKKSKIFYIIFLGSMRDLELEKMATLVVNLTRLKTQQEDVVLSINIVI